mmetsp:Transcript_84794/g.163408  ORF Transcript_84794/g.163408 Transcript_84794/m.163408 type:complete len:106 (-) Transcript_84794:153-470(-)
MVRVARFATALLMASNMRFVACVGGKGGLPPWWILNGVRPAGPPKNMGSYTVVTFSESQQEQFGVSESGEVKDQLKFEAALAAAKKAKTQAASEKKMNHDDIVNV